MSRVYLPSSAADNQGPTNLNSIMIKRESDASYSNSKSNTVSPAAVSIDATAKSAKMMKIYVYICRAIPIAAAVCALVYIIVLLANSDNWSTDINSDPADKLKREKARGAFVSVVMSILMNMIGAFMFHIGVKEGLVVTNYGFILGPVIGFVLDQGVGSDAGCRELFTFPGFKYSLSALVGGNFVRYIITVFLDLFISNPLQDIMKRQAQAAGIIELLIVPDDKPPMLQKYDHFVALNFPSILQSIVAFVTFNAYTNQTRFAWAYPSATLQHQYRIPPGTIMLATAASGVMYLVFYTVMDTFSDREYFAVNTKLFYVLSSFMILYGLNHTDSVEAPFEDVADNDVTEGIEDYKPLFGTMMLIAFIVYGFVYPVYTTLGCKCGALSCSPSGEDMDARDHLIDQPPEMQISGPLFEAIVKKLQSRKPSARNSVFVQPVQMPVRNSGLSHRTNGLV